jgi:hypothetical protein
MQEELVRQATQGDAEAFDSLARLVGDRCLAIATMRAVASVHDRCAARWDFEDRSL